jgi:signal transduction histidine kinase
MLENENVVITDEMKSEIHLPKLFESIISEYSSNIDDKGIKITTGFEAEHAIGNKNLIRQVFSNIIVNAVKYTEDGEITISTDHYKGHTRIRIKDTGIGFQPEKAEKLFDRFTKEKRKGTRGEATTGLGLYLCKKIVDRHFGIIEARSEGRNQGSEFEICLPEPGRKK